MATELSINTIIQIGKLSQSLSNIDNDKNIYFKGQTLDIMLPKKIYWVWKPLALRYAANPNDTTLRQVAEWLLQLCGNYALKSQNIIANLSGSVPVITGPANQSVLSGATATFSVSVTSATNVTYQWYVNGVLIPGATSSSYQVANAQTTQSGNTYFATATNSAGTVTSNTATLTVTASLTASYYYGTTDYSTILQGGIDSVPYLGTFPITTGQPLSFTWPSGAANNVYLVVRYPATESTKTTFSNAPDNNGNIPGIAFASIVVIGAYKYIFNKPGNGFSQNISAPLIFT
jgi:hypothetical protein